MRYFEDLALGEKTTSAPYTFTREGIIEFAQQWDPQPFHLDDAAAAQSLFGALCASGWHTACVSMRLAVGSAIHDIASLGSPGVDELRWLKPVFPGDTVTLTTEIIETRPSRSRADLGSIRVQHTLVNQHDETVLTMVGIGIVRRRPV